MAKTAKTKSIYGVHPGVKMMAEAPEFFRQWNPKNGWGDYEGALGYLLPRHRLAGPGLPGARPQHLHLGLLR